MKTIQKKWLPLFLLATVTFLFPACEGNNPDEDLAGVITIKMLNESNGCTWINLPGVSCVAISAANNFVVWQGEHGDLNAGIADVGRRKLSQITTLPYSGWVHEIAIQLEHCYIYKLENYGYNHENHYLKIYVKDWLKNTSGGIIGAEVKYCEWNPEQ